MTEQLFVEKDPFAPINYRYPIKRVLHERKSLIQEIKVLESEFFGRMMTLDDVIQLTERDEYMYHEMLAHVPMHSHPNPTNVLVIGGGDGGTLREVLKHKSVQTATLVDIDNEVSEVSKEYFPTLAVAFKDPRSRIKPNDGAVFLKETKEKFDVILVDAPDPVGPAQTLATPEFYTNAFHALTENGVFAMQTESLHFHLNFVQRIQDTLGKVFPWVGLYHAPIATYAGNWWTFSIASKVALRLGPVRPPVADTVYYGLEAHTRALVPQRTVAKLAEHYKKYGKGKV